MQRGFRHYHRSVASILKFYPLTRTAAEYPGNYSDCVKAKERKQREKHWTAYKDQQEFIAHLQRTIAAKK